jgi:hypothetical protein
MRKIDQAVLEQIELDYRAGVKSVNSIAKLHGLPEPTLRRLAKKHGWIRGAAEIKRRVVEDHFAGVTKGVTNDEVRQNQQEAADDDINDMERGLKVHRLCLIALLDAAETVKEPKEIKIISEATALAITGIRKIRGLDTPTPTDAKDIDAAIERELAIMAGRGQDQVLPNAEGSE